MELDKNEGEIAICPNVDKNEAKIADQYERFARKNNHTPRSLITQENVKAFVRFVLMEEDREKMVKKETNCKTKTG